MRILYIFPHPDDESFGPAPGMFKQKREGHEVYLLTLTRGGATKVRHRFGYSIEEMGNVRLEEMKAVERVLGLTGMTVLDLPDSGLKEMNPIELESIIEKHILDVKPDVVVTYAVHGVSGFQDHLVSHAVVKRVFCSLRESGGFAPKRCALLTLPEHHTHQSPFRLHSSTSEEIDCIIRVTEEDALAGKQALLCYTTYKETIEKTGILEHVHDPICYEFFRETFSPPAADLFDGL